MADPLIVAVPKGAWLKVATAVTAGSIHIVKKSAQYLQTYRETGGAAPVGTPGSEGAEMNWPGAPISALAPIDVYIYALSADGKVRVDV